MAPLLTGPERQTALARLQGWRMLAQRDALGKQFTFKNFTSAFAWMTQVAAVAEKLDHHPEWTNVYRSVDVILSTHDAGGLTDLDIQLALAMDQLASVST